MIITTYQLSVFEKALHGLVALNPNTTASNIQKTLASLLPDQDNSLSESTPGGNFFGQSDNCSIDTYK
jgi:hypothetical protein